MAKRKKITYEGRKRIVEYFEEEKKPSNGNGSNSGGKNEPEKGSWTA